MAKWDYIAMGHWHVFRDVSQNGVRAVEQASLKNLSENSIWVACPDLSFQ